MLQLLPSFSRLSLGSLSRRRAAPTGADDGDDDEIDRAVASAELMLLGRRDAPGPPQPRINDRGLSQNPQSVARRKQRAEQSARQPTSRKVNRNLGKNTLWQLWQVHRLKDLLRVAPKHSNGTIDINEVEKRFNEGLTDAEQRTVDQIRGQIRYWRDQEGDDRNDNKVKRIRWSPEEEERLTRLATRTPKLSRKEIEERFNEGLAEAAHRDKDQIGRKLRHITKRAKGRAQGSQEGEDAVAEPEPPSEAETEDNPDFAEGAGA